VLAFVDFILSEECYRLSMALISSVISRVTQQENINFLLTNRIPRRYVTLFMGWFSRIEFFPVKFLSIKIWKLFAHDLDLNEAKKTSFTSMHDCFIRELKAGARTIHPAENIISSPCDAIIGSFGKINDTQLFQAKGFPYTLDDLLPRQDLVDKYRNGLYVTLRLKSTMYHRFHAPYAGSISEINYISGDTWNVNPIALKRVEKLYCKNERAVLDIKLDNINANLTLVPVAAIMVASLRFKFLAETLDLKYKGPNRISCNVSFNKGEELGYFQHGSTIIVFASNNLKFCDNIILGQGIKMGEALFSI